jgi:hypothetical protein
MTVEVRGLDAFAAPMELRAYVSEAALLPPDWRATSSLQPSLVLERGVSGPLNVELTVTEAGTVPLDLVLPGELKDGDVPMGDRLICVSLDAAGNVRPLEDLPSKRVMLAEGKHRFYAVYRRSWQRQSQGNEIASAFAQIDVKQAEHQVLSIRLDEANSIRGRALNDSGEPLAYREIYATFADLVALPVRNDLRDGLPAFRSFTDSDGSFAFHNVQDGHDLVLQIGSMPTFIDPLFGYSIRPGPARVTVPEFGGSIGDIQFE